jgi:glucans biosynthesis protein C
MKKNKDQSVETLRGLAIILVVLGHVIGSDNSGGMKVADDSFLRHLYYTFEYLRMPLFTTISGWVYALRPASFGLFNDFMVKKIRRILIPLFVIGTLYFLLQQVTPGANSKESINNIWRIYFFPYTLYWYLPALFWVFLIVALIDSYKIMQSKGSWIVITLVALGIMILRDVIIPEHSPNLFAYKMAIYLLPFFLIGVGINRFPDLFRNRTLRFISFLLLICLMIVQQLVWYKVLGFELSKTSGIGLIIGVAGSIVLLGIRWRIRWLIWIGGYAYTIYLFHAFGTAAGRIIPKVIGITSTTAIFLLSLMVGMLLPVIVEMIADRFSLSRMLLLGRPYNKNNGRE